MPEVEIDYKGERGQVRPLRYVEAPLPATVPETDQTCPCGCGAPMLDGRPFADHPHTDPGDGRTECPTCGKWVHLVIHSCKGVPVTVAARDRVCRPG